MINEDANYIDENVISKCGFRFYEIGLNHTSTDIDFLYTIWNNQLSDKKYYANIKYDKGDNSVKSATISFLTYYNRQRKTGKFLNITGGEVSFHELSPGFDIVMWQTEALLTILVIYFSYLIFMYNDGTGLKIKQIIDKLVNDKTLYRRTDRLDLPGSVFVNNNGTINKSLLYLFLANNNVNILEGDTFVDCVNEFWIDLIPEEWLPTEDIYLNFIPRNIQDIIPINNIKHELIYTISNKEFKCLSNNSELVILDIYIPENEDNKYELVIFPDDIPNEWTTENNVLEPLYIDLLTGKDLYGCLIMSGIYTKYIHVLGPTLKHVLINFISNNKDCMFLYFLNKVYKDNLIYEGFGPIGPRKRNLFLYYNLKNTEKTKINKKIRFNILNKDLFIGDIIYDFTQNTFNELYINEINFELNLEINIKETKKVAFNVKIPVDCRADNYNNPVYLRNIGRMIPMFFTAFTLGLPEGEIDPFTFDYLFNFKYLDPLDYSDKVESPYTGTLDIFITCRHKRFTNENKIYVGLRPYESIYKLIREPDSIYGPIMSEDIEEVGKYYLNLGHDHIPYTEISFTPSEDNFYIDIPEGTKFEIFNDRIDVLDLNVLGTLYDDDIYYEYEFVNNEDFSKRLVEPIITFEDWNTKLRVDVIGQDSDLRTDSVFYNLTDHDFEGLLKLWIKAVNGLPVDNDYYEIPVVYHNYSEHNFMLKNANISINADSSGTVYLGNIFNSGYGVGYLRNNSLLSTSGLFITYSDRNIFQEAEGYFGSYGQDGLFDLRNVKQNTTVNNKQTRLFIYPYFEGMTGNEDFLNDEEMFPRVVLDITLNSVSLTDPFVNDDRFENSDDGATVLRLNNIVSTPITLNKYSVNLTSFSRDDYMKLTDKLYFIEPSPLYVSATTKEVVLHYYYYREKGFLKVSFLNQDTYLPGIQDVILNEDDKTVTVKLILNKDLTSQGYVSLYDGSVGIKIGIFLIYGK